MTLLAAQSPGTTAPARGAPLSDLITLTIVFAVAGLLLLAVSVAHRRGRFTWLQRLGDFAESTSGLPPWAALPQSIGAVSLVTAAFGFYWDVSWHIDRGRDPGPLANPAHYFIIFGLAGLALCAVRHGVLERVELTAAGETVEIAPIPEAAAPIVLAEDLRDLGAATARSVIEAIGGSLTLEGKRLLVRLPA